VNFKTKMAASLALLLALAAPAGEVIHERIEWSEMWVTNADREVETRVLLVGDSIVRGYYAGVEKALGDDVSCARYTTSKFLDHPDFLPELGLVLKRFNFDVIHLNNGLHGWGYTEEQYREGVEALMNYLGEKAPEAKLIWGMTTPVRIGNHIETVDEEKTGRVVARNRIALKIMGRLGVAVNDLFGLSADHTEHFAQDGVHFSEAGKTAQADQVASAIRGALAPG